MNRLQHPHSGTLCCLHPTALPLLGVQTPPAPETLPLLLGRTSTATPLSCCHTLHLPCPCLASKPQTLAKPYSSTPLLETLVTHRSKPL